MKLYKKTLPSALAVACCLPLIGCHGPYTPSIIPAHQVNLRHEVIGYSVQNRQVDLFTLGSGPDKTLIIATIHGNEDAGTPLVYRLIDHLKARPKLLETRTVQIVPLANPDGYDLRTRGNANGIDLNRNFPAANRENNAVNGPSGLSEPESALLYELILAHRPARIVSIHQPLNCLDYDGPGTEIAEAMAAFCDLPVKKLGSRPGSLGSFAGVEQNIPIITMELLKEDGKLTATQLWETYGEALQAAITYPDLPY